MGVRLKLVGTRVLYKEGKCVYLSNHRAWADFFIDVYITEVGDSHKCQRNQIPAKPTTATTAAAPISSSFCQRR